MSQESESPLLKKAEHAFGELFELARQRDELNFALSLSPEFKPYTLTSAIDAQRAYKEYEEFLEKPEFAGTGIRLRVALAFYCHVAEAAGLWGVPMCMLWVLEGRKYNLEPFYTLVREHRDTGKIVAPNANKVMGALAGAASNLGLTSLSEVFRDAFDPDLRNGFAHADYALSNAGVHVRGRHDQQRLIAWPELEKLLNDGIGLFHVLGQVIHKYQILYQVPKVVFGAINDREPQGYWLIRSDAEARTMSVSGGPGWTEETLLANIDKKPKTVDQVQDL